MRPQALGREAPLLGGEDGRPAELGRAGGIVACELQLAARAEGADGAGGQFESGGVAGQALGPAHGVVEPSRGERRLDEREQHAGRVRRCQLVQVRPADGGDRGREPLRIVRQEDDGVVRTARPHGGAGRQSDEQRVALRCGALGRAALTAGELHEGALGQRERQLAAQALQASRLLGGLHVVDGGPELEQRQLAGRQERAEAEDEVPLPGVPREADAAPQHRQGVPEALGRRQRAPHRPDAVEVAEQPGVVDRAQSAGGCVERPAGRRARRQVGEREHRLGARERLGRAVAVQLVGGALRPPQAARDVLGEERQGRELEQDHPAGGRRRVVEHLQQDPAGPLVLPEERVGLDGRDDQRGAVLRGPEGHGVVERGAALLQAPRRDEHARQRLEQLCARLRVVVRQEAERGAVPVRGRCRGAAGRRPRRGGEHGDRVLVAGPGEALDVVGAERRRRRPRGEQGGGALVGGEAPAGRRLVVDGPPHQRVAELERRPASPGGRGRRRRRRRAGARASSRREVGRDGRDVRIEGIARDGGALEHERSGRRRRPATSRWTAARTVAGGAAPASAPRRASSCRKSGLPSASLQHALAQVGRSSVLGQQRARPRRRAGAPARSSRNPAAARAASRSSAAGSTGRNANTSRCGTRGGRRSRCTTNSTEAWSAQCRSSSSSANGCSPAQQLEHGPQRPVVPEALAGRHRHAARAVGGRPGRRQDRGDLGAHRRDPRAGSRWRRARRARR